MNKAERTKRAEVVEMMQPITPRSERRPLGRIAPVGVPDMGCPHPRCIRWGGHEGDHYPA